MSGQITHIGRSVELSSARNELLSAGSTLIVTGPSGIGKTFFARHVAEMLHCDIPVEVVRIRGSWGARDTPFHAFSGLIPQLLQDEFPTPIAALQAVTDALIRPNGDVLLIADDAHDYDPMSLELLGALASAPGVRLIITARGGSTNASWLFDRLERDGYAARIYLGELTTAESRELIASVFQSESVEKASALRLHEISGGNPLLLSRYCEALLRSGSVTTTGSFAFWNGVGPAHGSTAELFSAELRQLSDLERSALLTISLTEPLPELLARALCDVDAIDSLSDAALISLVRDQGDPYFTVLHPVIAEASRDGATPGEIVNADLAFLDALPSVIPEHSPALALRMVAISMEHGRPVRLTSLRRAFTIACAAGDQRLAVRIADLLIEHASTTLFERLDARTRRLRMLRSVDFPRYRRVSLDDELSWTVPQVGDDTALLKRRVSLAFAVFDALVGRDDAPEQAVEAVQRVYAALPPGSEQVEEYFALKLTPRLGTIGRFDEAMHLSLAPQVAAQNRVGRLTGAAVQCLILGQRGDVNEARAIASQELPFARMHLPDVPEAVGDLFASWFFIASLAGRIPAMETLQRELEEHLSQRPALFLAEASYLEMCAGLLASSQGRWQEASGQFEAAIARLELSDPSGYLVSVAAIAAFAYAAAGRADAARREMERCVSLPLGGSRTIEGILRLNLVRARLWLGDRKQAQAEARDLALWAQERSFALVELRALHLASLAGDRSLGLIDRAAALIPHIDGEIGLVIVAHMRTLRTPEIVNDQPSTRTLARLGIWIPLPVGTDLTEREREVANYASLGYSSKWIGTTLQISRRTVETHLTHLYLKLGVTERDSLAERLVELSEHAEASVWPAA